MNNYEKAIKEMIRFKEAIESIDPNSKIPKKLVGEVGEFYVLNKLKKLGLKFSHKGGQAGYDILIESNGKKVAVRTSLPKNEGLYPKTIKFFGWRVNNRNQKKDEKFDILIGVALGEAFRKPKFYIFTHQEAFSVEDVDIGRFKNVQKKIYLFKSDKAYKEATKVKPEIVTKYERYINEHQPEFHNKWEKILGTE